MKKKTESRVQPEQFKITQHNNKAYITFAENIEEVTRNVKTTPYQRKKNAEIETETVYLYDRYTLTVPYRDGLADDVSNNFNKWLEKAKQADYDSIAEQVRAKRDALLAETDKEFSLDRVNLNIPEKVTSTTMLSAIKDVFDALGSVCNGEMAKYRKALRDIPEQKGFPYDVKFPAKPY